VLEVDAIVARLAQGELARVPRSQLLRGAARGRKGLGKARTAERSASAERETKREVNEPFLVIKLADSWDRSRWPAERGHLRELHVNISSRRSSSSLGCAAPTA
jgi:hypothetical protein